MRICILSMVLLASCAGCRDGSGTDTGNSCEIPDDCYPDVERDELSGTVECLDRVEGGYCTHECDTDDDCCAADGECADDAPEQVCAPFESTGQRLCFLSCEGLPDSFCTDELSEEFGCRSTGGGSSNRKVCVPGG